MTLRPATARWFELLTDREHLGELLRALAMTGTVELEAHSGLERPAALPDYAATLSAFGELARRFRGYWPAPRIDPARPPPESIAGAEGALAALGEWARSAEPELVALQRATAERASVAEFESLLAAAPSGVPLLELAGCRRLLASRLYALTEPAPPLPASLLVAGLSRGTTAYLAALGSPEDCATLDRELLTRHARRVELPAGLAREPEAARTQLRQRLAALDREIGVRRTALAALEDRHHLAALLAGFAFLEWLVANVPRLPATEHFAWVTGWCADRDGQALGAALERAGLPHLLHFPAAPAGAVVPVVLANPRWLRAFEVFVRLVGTPRGGEADPTPIVAFVAPLLFGFMFGDVAQGALLFIAGLALWQRLPALRLLVPGGASAMLFGGVFGSVAAREDLIRAWWLHPLQAPLAVLALGIALGGLVIAGGLLVDALAHLWRGEARRWLLLRGGLLIAYAALLASLVVPGAWPVVLIGLAWSVAGPLIVDARVAGAAIGEAVETLLQLLINTVSFARVGAFALAHAGLSAAIVGIAAAAGGGAGTWIVLVIGNLMIVVIEGVVVGIQTTRLILFEFFIRFLHADGRPLRPLPPTPGASVPH